MVDLLNSDQTNALGELNQYLSNDHSATSLTVGQLRKYSTVKPIAGWRLCVGVHNLDLIIPPNYPYTHPYIYLQGQPKVLIWPHIETDNRVCVLPGHAVFDVFNPVSVASHILNEAHVLLDELNSGQRQEDFISEFENYWNVGIKLRHRDIVNLLTIVPYSREISYWPGVKRIYMANSDSEGSVWLQKFFDNNKKYKPNEFKRGLFLWLHDGVRPPYPATANEVLKLAESVGAENLLKDLLQDAPEQIPIAFGFPSGNGPALGGIWIKRPVNTSIPGRPRDCLTDGFRADYMHERTLHARYLSNKPIERITVERADPEWIHGRGGCGYDKELAVKNIVMIGCGSVGSGVLELIVQSGFVNITIIDPDILKWENIGRHKLGGKKSLYRSKVESIKSDLELRFPHLNIQPYPKKWEDVWEESPEVFTKSDVIVSTMSEWATEAALNRLARGTINFPDLVFGWIEAHAAAAHVLIVRDVGGCLNCGMNNIGVFKNAAIKWENSKQMLQTPACGGYYQPYGAIDLVPSHHLISSAILSLLKGDINKSEHHVWFGDLKRIKDLNGNWGESWTGTSDEPEQGLRIIKRSWSASCDQCI